MPECEGSSHGIRQRVGAGGPQSRTELETAWCRLSTVPAPGSAEMAQKEEKGSEALRSERAERESAAGRQHTVKSMT